MPLGDIVVQPDGNEVILTGQGWVPNTPELEAAASLGFFESAAVGFAEMMSMGMIKPPEGLEEVNPAGLKAGQAAGVLGIASPALSGAQRMMQAVRGARGTSAATAGVTATEGGGFMKTSQGFWKLPSDVVPKAMQGSVRSLEAGLGGLPLGRVGIDVFNMQRRGRLGGKAGRVLGMTPEELSASGGRLRAVDVDAAMNRIDDVYDSARSLVDEKVGLAQVKKIADEAAEAGVITSKDVAMLTNKADRAGDQLIELRSISRQLARNGSHLERRRANEIISEINDMITDAAKGTNVAQQLAVADRQYKFWKVIDGSGVIDGEGWLNLASLKRNAANVFSRRTVRGAGAGSARRESLRPVEQDLLAAIDELGEINYRIPTSGTAERAIAASMIGGLIGIPVLTH